MLSPSLTVPAHPSRDDGVQAVSPDARRMHAAGGELPDRSDIELEYDQCAALFYRFFAVRVGGDQHAADDLMQQLWLAAAKNGRGVPAGEGEFWLRAVARNLLASHWRRHARPAAAPMADPALAAELADTLDASPLPPTLIMRREVRDQVLLAMTELSAADHEIIVAHYWRGSSFAELGSQLGLTPRAVEGRLYRARAALRVRLREVHDSPQGEAGSIG